MENSTMFFAILIFAAFSFLSFYQFRKYRNISANALYMETSKIGDIQQALYEIGLINNEDSSYKHYSELKEKLKANVLSICPFSSNEVAFYQAQIIEHYIERKEEKDSEGNRKVRWVSGSRYVNQFNSKEEIYIEDEVTGTRCILDKDNNFDCPVTFNINVRNKQDNLVRQYDLYFRDSFDIRTEYFSFVENTLNVGDDLYILGEAYYDENKELHIHQSSDKNSMSLVSNKTEEEVVSSYRNKAVLFFGLGVFTAVIGVIMLVNLFI